MPSVRNFGEQLVRYSDEKKVSLLRINVREPQLPNKPNCYGVDMGALDALTELKLLMAKE